MAHLYQSAAIAIFNDGVFLVEGDQLAERREGACIANDDVLSVGVPVNHEMLAAISHHRRQVVPVTANMRNRLFVRSFAHRVFDEVGR